MYSEEDINSAVAAGALSAEAASSFRAHMSKRRELPRGDEENFRLINSFNDIFVAIGVVIMLLAAGGIGQQFANAFTPLPIYPTPDASQAVIDGYIAQDRLRTGAQMLLGGILVGMTAWLLAEFFTRRRHMALPSIVLLLAFVGAVFSAILGIGNILGLMHTETAGGILISASGLVAAGAAYLHWKRFMVPITIAAGAGALAVTLIGLVGAIAGGPNESALLLMVEIAGLAIFVLAMRWDMSDRERTTRRSDVAFWLHLLAAPMIAHPLFYSLGVMNDAGAVGVGGALGVVGIYVLFGLIALAIDRRALLVSALAYVLAALTLLFDRFGAVELTFALTALVIGSALLTLSAFWAPIRAKVVKLLPANWHDRLPVAGVVPG